MFQIALMTIISQVDKKINNASSKVYEQEITVKLSLHHSMASKTNWTDMDSRLPELPSVIKDPLVIKYLEEFKDVTPPTGITYKQLTGNSKSFPRYENLAITLDKIYSLGIL